MALALSAVETGYWSPRDRMMRVNNWFGFKKNKRGYAMGYTPDLYCRYFEPVLSMNDYAAYERQVIKKYGIQSQKEYLAHIFKRYNPNSSFRGKLTRAHFFLQQIEVELWT